MQVVTSYPDGIFNWVDLSTTDVAGAKAFYGGLFGWDAVDIPTDMGPMYTMCRIDGYNVAGMGPLPPDMQAQGVPPNWMSYVKHDNVDAVAAKAAAAGGMVTMPPMDVMSEGRMALLLDPTGAMVGLWQPKNHIGAQLVNRPNTLVWNELQTRDSSAAKAFYADTFGWSFSSDPTGYITCKDENGRIHAGMMQMDDSWGDVPPNWAVYFMVTDVEATLTKAQELGGTILVPITSAGSMGRFIVVQDPQGAIFTAMQFDGPVDNPPGT